MLQYGLFGLFAAIVGYGVGLLIHRQSGEKNVSPLVSTSVTALATSSDDRMTVQVSSPSVSGRVLLSDPNWYLIGPIAFRIVAARSRGFYGWLIAVMLALAAQYALTPLHRVEVAAALFLLAAILIIAS